VRHELFLALVLLAPVAQAHGAGGSGGAIVLPPDALDFGHVIARVAWDGATPTAGLDGTLRVSLARVSEDAPGAVIEPNMEPGGTTSITFDESWAGIVLRYHCHPHPFMTGNVTVQRGAEVSNENLIVRVHGFMYDPSEITIAPGTNVTWVNEDNVNHTIHAMDPRVLALGIPMADAQDMLKLEVSQGKNRTLLALRPVENLTGVYEAHYTPPVSGAYRARLYGFAADVPIDGSVALGSVAPAAGTGPPGTRAVPEPLWGVLVMLAAVAFIRRR